MILRQPIVFPLRIFAKIFPELLAKGRFLSLAKLELKSKFSAFVNWIMTSPPPEGYTRFVSIRKENKTSAFPPVKNGIIFKEQTLTIKCLQNDVIL